MKILCLSPWFPEHPQDQCGNYILDSTLALKNIGHEVTVLVVRPWKPKLAKYFHTDFVNRKTNKEEFPEIDLHQCYYISIPRNILRIMSNFFYIKFVSLRIKKILNNRKYDIIHAHGELAALAAVNVGKQYSIPTVVTLHGIETNKRFWSSSKHIIREALIKADKLVLVGEPLRIFFNSLLFNKKNFHVVPNGFRAVKQSFNEKRFLEFNPLRIISVSNLHEGKGININLLALAQLNESGATNWIYTIVGGGREREKLQNLTVELNLSSQVFFVGPCNHDEVFRHLNQSQVFLLPSYREAFGIVYLEAMSCGLLTIAVDNQGAAAFIENRKTGLLVAPNDVNAIVDTLKEIHRDPVTMSAIAVAGQAYVCQNLTWNDHAKKLTIVYCELLKDKYYAQSKQ